MIDKKVWFCRKINGRKYTIETKYGFNKLTLNYADKNAILVTKTFIIRTLDNCFITDLQTYNMISNPLVQSTKFWT